MKPYPRTADFVTVAAMIAFVGFAVFGLIRLMEGEIQLAAILIISGAIGARSIIQRRRFR